jgi:endonuclease G
MKSKQVYSIIAVIIVVGIFTYEHYQNSEEQLVIVETGKIPKENTNEYFLPTSTTNQIIHHQNY